jgi:hypothetical protein
VNFLRQVPRQQSALKHPHEHKCWLVLPKKICITFSFYSDNSEKSSAGGKCIKVSKSYRRKGMLLQSIGDACLAMKPARKSSEEILDIAIVGEGQCTHLEYTLPEQGRDLALRFGGQAISGSLSVPLSLPGPISSTGLELL